MDARARLALVLILALGLVLRVVGLDWGLPSPRHLASYHPDEWQITNNALLVAFGGGGLNPRFFHYPTAPIYLAALIFKLLGLVLTPSAANLGAYCLVARLITVACGVATLPVVVALGARLGSTRVGLLAALLLAVMPLPVVHGHYATVDVPLTFWCALALLAAVTLTDASLEPRAVRRWLLTAGLAAGLAMGTKYNGVLVLGPVWLGLAVARRGARAAVGVTALALAVFALSSPYVFLDPAAWPQIRFELLEHPRQTNLFRGVGPGWWFHLRWNLPTGCGGLVALAAVVGLAGWRGRATGPLWLWLGLVALSLTRSAELFIRYWLPLTPVLALAAADSVRRLPRRTVWRFLVAALLVAGPALRARAYTAMLAREDARDAALAWCQANIPAGARVGEIEPTWFWSVPLRANNRGRPTGTSADESRWRLCSDPEAWPAEPPDWLVINDAKRRERYHDAAGAARWAELTRGYERVFVCANQAVVLPGRVETGRGSRLHDWLYPLPAIEVWRRGHSK
jgi:4-amino-4-deoxy-L-arabinose transferase-like glycosyltransferase